MALSSWLRFSPPKKFLYLMSLRTGAEMITLSVIFNKATGFYGLLAILTGLKLNPLQFSMYIYSVAALVLIAFLMPHIRKQSPMQCLLLAYFYLFDTIINCAYTAAFAVSWFLTVSASHSDTEGGVPPGTPGSGTIDDTAGFTSPQYNVSEVNVVVAPAAGLAGGEAAVAIGSAATASVAATAGNPSLYHGVHLTESLPSILIIVGLNLIRVYFILIMFAYARQVLRQYVRGASPNRHQQINATEGTSLDNPFASTAPLGQGWRGKLGRIMVSIGKGFWFNTAADDEWARDISTRFKSQSTQNPREIPGTVERERRARSGTGPPRPSGEVLGQPQSK